MKRIFLPVAILAVLILTSRGSSTSHTINGQWFSSLVNQNDTLTTSSEPRSCRESGRRSQ